MITHTATLAQLIPPPPGKTGWPWDEETPQLPSTLPDGSLWPKISIVTPSYNQAQYLEETIRSVLLQGYPNLEYIIIDGGSTDGSVEIIKKYEPWLTYWVSEPDRGQSHAINKGFEKSTGEIMAWINSDDYYAPGAFEIIAKTFSQNDTHWVAGNCYMIQVNGDLMYKVGKLIVRMDRWLLNNQYVQPEVFWRRSIWTNAHGVDEDMHYSFDYDLWLKFTRLQPYPYWINKFLAYFRIHEKSKTGISREPFDREDEIIFQRYRKNLTIREKFHVWQLRKESQAKHHLSLEDFSEPPIKKIFLGLLSAPWFLFKRYFYYKVKQILLHSMAK